MVWRWIVDKFDVSGGNPNMSGIEIVSDKIDGEFSVFMM